MGKTLFISDLDGTLLNSDALLSDESATLLNEAIAHGALFSVATARTPSTVSLLLEKVNLSLPLIVMTGAALWDSRSDSFLYPVTLDLCSASRILEIFRARSLPVFIYRLIDDRIHIYHSGPLSPLEREFINARGYSRYKIFHIDESGESWLPSPLTDVVLFYAMQPTDLVEKVYREIREKVECNPVFYHDMYGEEIGILEVFSPHASKAEALKRLKHIAALSKGEAALSKGEAALSKGEADLSQCEAGLSKGEAALSKGEAGLSKDEAALSKGVAALPQGEAGLSQCKAALSKCEAALPQCEAGLSKGETGLSKCEAALSKGETGLPQGEAALSKGVAALSKGIAALPQCEAALSKGVAALSQGEAALSQGEAGLSKCEAGLSKGEAGLPQCEAGLSKGVAALSQGEAGLSKCETGLSKGEVNVVAFGDNINDIPMLRKADLAVVVANAKDEVKACADIVIGPNTENSVARFIYSYTLKL